MTTAGNQDTRENALDKRLDSVAWALFLIMIGGLWLVPDGVLPEGTWLIGAGLIILGLTVVRLVTGIKISGFWVFMGFLALGSGLADVFGLNVPVFPILLVIAGLAIIVQMLVRR